jgi:nucleosome binding factor SPN SPT16 subunit
MADNQDKIEALIEVIERLKAGCGELPDAQFDALEWVFSVIASYADELAVQLRDRRSPIVEGGLPQNSDRGIPD